MKEQELHPSIVSFKHFVNNHPALLRELRKSGRSWQEYYEKWALLGEDDPYWDQFMEKSESTKHTETKSNEKNFELISQIMKLTENIDINKIQGQVSNLSKTIGTVQELVNQFQESKQEKSREPHPFDWFHD
ncbi:YlbD family protein [Oceanobacillus senegalensis]|uniref:YlbD family protein n=1 Tax=Oceanobacillus senegalensis TaxID=1936063 RepID=UPI000A308F13|nr:spore coat protein YlbD [Oceanobacillus senegalensis]